MFGYIWIIGVEDSVEVMIKSFVFNGNIFGIDFSWFLVFLRYIITLLVSAVISHFIIL